jgi:hypothetical protein
VYGIQQNCNPSRKHQAPLNNRTDNCRETEGCTFLTLKSIPLNGFLKAVCFDDDFKEEKTISDVFCKKIPLEHTAELPFIRIHSQVEIMFVCHPPVREDIHWDTTKDEDLIHLYVNMVASTDQNPQREVQTIGSNIDWQIGATVVFSCAAAPFLFSSGIKWAVQMKDGSMVYQKDS